MRRREPPWARSPSRAGVAVALAAASLTATAGCGSSSPPAAPVVSMVPSASSPPGRAPAGGPATDFPRDGASWKLIEAERLRLSFPLPDADRWSVREGGGEVVAEHGPTQSRLAVRVVAEGQRATREGCEERARALGYVPQGRLETIERETLPLAGVFDATLWVATAAPATGAAPAEDTAGYVMAFGAQGRRCLLVRYETRAPASDDAVLVSRLAAIRSKVVPAIRLDEATTVPREKAGPSR